MSLTMAGGGHRNKEMACASEQEPVIAWYWPGWRKGGRCLRVWPKRGEGHGVGAERREGRKENLTSRVKWALLWA